VVFLVSGLWHGAAWTYVIWGAIHGTYQIIGNLTIKSRNRLLGRMKLSEKSLPVVIFRRIGVFILVCFAWLFFRANSMADAVVLLKSLFVTGWNVGLTDALVSMNLISPQTGLTPLLICVFSILILLMIDNVLKYEDGEGASYLLVKRGSFVYFVWIIMFAWAILLSQDIASTFIYFQF
jgi:D-alanyl-lipoteichoic acid acyltransferase DltB (MBOAT superfamily)